MSSDGASGDRGGSSAPAVPKLNRAVALSALALTPEEGFVYSRIDDRTTIHEICLISGLGEARTMALLARLREVGAILFPGDVSPPPTPVASPANAPAPSSPRPAALAEGRPPAAIRWLASYDAALVAEPCDLTENEKKRILDVVTDLDDRDLFEMLEIAESGDKRDIKRAYFRAAKEFHPDRFFGKKLGSFGARLEAIFKRLTLAFETLGDDGKRTAYLARREEARRRGVPAGRVAEGALLSAPRSARPAGSRGIARAATPSLSRTAVPGATVTSSELDPRAKVSEVRSQRAARARRYHDDGMASLLVGRGAIATATLRLAVVLVRGDETHREALDRAEPVAREEASERMARRAEAAAELGRAPAALRLAKLATRALPAASSYRRAATIAERVHSLEAVAEYVMKASKLELPSGAAEASRGATGQKEGEDATEPLAPRRALPRAREEGGER